MPDKLILTMPAPPDPPQTGPGTMRVASLKQVPVLLREHGFEPRDVLVGLGLAPEALDASEGTIPYATAGKILQRCADITGCRHFGLLAGQLLAFKALGILGELMQRSPSVQVAFRSAVQYLQSRGGVITHGTDGDNAFVGYAIYQRDMPGAIQAYDLAIAMAFNVLKGLCGPHWLPREVTFTQSTPPDLVPYRNAFGPLLRFNADRTVILFSKAWLEQVPPRADPHVHRVLLRAVAMQELQRPADLSDQVRRAVRTISPRAMASESLVSDALSIPIRTLRRHLAAQGTTFRALLDDVRYEFARQLLEDTDLSTTGIAEVMGYADASAFNRAFRRWTGLPPGAWRLRMKDTPGK